MKKKIIILGVLLGLALTAYTVYCARFSPIRTDKLLSSCGFQILTDTDEEPLPPNRWARSRYWKGTQEQVKDFIGRTENLGETFALSDEGKEYQKTIVKMRYPFVYHSSITIVDADEKLVEKILPDHDQKPGWYVLEYEQSHVSWNPRTLWDLIWNK